MHWSDTLAIVLNFQDDCPESRLKTAIFGHQIAHRIGWTAQNHMKLVSDDTYLLGGRCELL